MPIFLCGAGADAALAALESSSPGRAGPNAAPAALADPEGQYQEAATALERELKRNPGNQDALLSLARLKLDLADHSPKRRKALTLEALGLLERAGAASGGGMWREAILLETACVRAELAAWLEGGEKRAAFARAAGDYLASDQEKVLRSVESYTPSVGWVMTLLHCARESAQPQVRRELMAEAARLGLDKSFIKADLPSQRLFLAEALLFGEALLGLESQKSAPEKAVPEKSAQAKSAREKVAQDKMLGLGLVREALRITDEVLAQLPPPSDDDRRDASPRGLASLYRGLGLLALAALDDGPGRGKSLAAFHAELLNYLERSAWYYTSYQARSFAEERAPLLWERAAKALDGEALFYSARGLWEVVFGESGNTAGRELLRLAAALAPCDPEVWRAYALAAARDSYGASFTAEESLGVYERLACLESGPEPALAGEITGWRLWSENFDRSIGHGGGEEYPATARAVTERIQALSGELSCPAFAAYAEGRLEQKRNREGYERALELFARATALPHQEAAGAYIHGSAGDAWFNANRHNYPAEKLTPEERLELLSRARAQYRQALAAYASHPSVFDGASGRDRGFSWGGNYASVLRGLMENPFCPLDAELLQEARARSASLRGLGGKPGQEPGEAVFLEAWARDLRSSAYTVGYTYKGPEGERRRRELLDLALEAYPRIEELKSASAPLYAAWGGARLERARLEARGKREELLRRAVENYERSTQLKASGEGYAGLAKTRLLLCLEGLEGETPDLMARAYAEFCLAAGLPEGTPRSRQYWKEVVLRESAEAPEELKAAILAALP